MELETERLILRHLKDDDLESIFYNYANDPEVTKFLSWPAHKTFDDTRSIINYWKNDDKEIQKYNFFIILKETNELIGNCAVVAYDDGIPEIGYIVGRKWWNKGIATEACKRLIKHLFDNGFNKVIIKADKDNVQSLKVLQKCGFTYIGQETKIYGANYKKEMTCNVYEIENK